MDTLEKRGDMHARIGRALRANLQLGAAFGSWRVSFVPAYKLGYRSFPPPIAASGQTLISAKIESASCDLEREEWPSGAIFLNINSQFILQVELILVLILNSTVKLLLG